MRSKLYEVLKFDSTLTDMLASGVDSIFSASSVRGEPALPFIVIRFGTTGEWGNVNSSDPDEPIVEDDFYYVFGYDTPGDYLLLDQIHNRVRRLFHNQTFELSPNHCATVKWLGTSEDFTADEYRAIGKFTRLRAARRREVDQVLVP